MTNQEKQNYMNFISSVLDLKADVTIERITPEIVAKVDEFINQVATCTRRVNNITNIFKALGNGKLKDIAEEILNAYIDELEEKRSDYANLICYSALKNRYAQEIQYIWLMGF